MKSCDQYLPELCAWLDGELEDSRELEDHLAGCASCRAIAAQYRRMDAMLADVTPPANLHSHIMSGITAPHAPKAKRRFAFGSAAAVAATAAVLLLVVGAGLVAIPRWTGANKSADTAAYAADPVEAPSTFLAVSGTNGAEYGELTESKAAATDEAEAAVTEPVEAPSVEQVAVDTTADAVEEDAIVPEGLEETATAEPDLGYALTTSGGDMAFYPGASPEDSAEESATAGGILPAGGDLLDDYAIEEIQLRVAAGEQLTWTIYGTSLEDLPTMLRSNINFVRVGADALWVGTLESGFVLELYTLLAEDLGGELGISDNDTGSIVLDCR